MHKRNDAQVPGMSRSETRLQIWRTFQWCFELPPRSGHGAERNYLIQCQKDLFKGKSYISESKHYILILSATQTDTDFLNDRIHVNHFKNHLFIQQIPNLS